MCVGVYILSCDLLEGKKEKKIIIGGFWFHLLLQMNGITQTALPAARRSSRSMLMISVMTVCVFPKHIFVNFSQFKGSGSGFPPTKCNGGGGGGATLHKYKFYVLLSPR